MFGCFLCSDTATIEIYTLSLHDALPISRSERESPTVEVSGAAAVGVLDPQLPDPLAVLGGEVDRVGHVEVGVVVTRDGALEFVQAAVRRDQPDVEVAAVEIGRAHV